MNFATYLYIALFATQVPLAGDYKVISDKIEADTISWGAYCGIAQASEGSSMGQVLKVTVEGDEWRATGGGRRFGSRTCEGENLSLTLQARRKATDKTQFECASTRIVRGAETSEHITRSNPSEGTIAFDSVNIRTYRQKGDLCRLKVTRKTLIKKLAESKKGGSLQSSSTLTGPGETKKRKDIRKCNVVGEPKKLKYYGDLPTVLTKGQRFCFDVRATDAKGCVVEWAPLRWRLSSKRLGRISRSGCLKPPMDTKRSKGRVVARLGRRQLTIPFKITEPPTVLKEPGDAMNTLDAGQAEPLILKRDGGLSPSPEFEPEKKMAPNSGIRPAEVKPMFPAWLGVVLLLGTVLGWAIVRAKVRKPAWQLENEELEIKPARKARRRRKRNRKRKKKKRRKKKLKCQRNFQIVRARFTPNPATGILVPSDKKTCKPASEYDSDLGPAPLPEYCPDCGRRYPPSRFAKCPLDGSLLEPLTPEVPQQTVSLEVKGRVCEVCFTYYDAEMAFCPKDNAPLFVDLGQWETIKEELLEKNEKINVQRSFQSEKKPQGEI